MVKFTVFLRRLPSLTHAEFIRYHREKHGPLFRSIPAVQQHVRRYVQSHPLEGDTLVGFSASSFDGVAEIWFDDVSSFETVFTDDEYMRIIRPDEKSFIDIKRCDMMLTTENVVIE